MYEYKMEEYYGETKAEIAMNRMSALGWRVIAVCNLTCYDTANEERYTVTYERRKD